MSHWNEEKGLLELKQVEVNIGQVGGPGSAQQAAKVHRKMLEKVDNMHRGELPILANAQLAENRSRQKMALAIYQCWKLFGDPKAVVVFMNQPDLFPVCHFEQLQFIQFELEKLGRQEGHYLNVLRMSIKEGVERLHLDEQGDFSLVADGNRRVGLVHMAYGYLPEHYPSPREWALRLDMERSTAIISPNIRLQLTGTKKIQQVLANPGVIERFLPDQPERVAALRKTFTGLWGLESDTEPIRAVIQDAICQPRKYVLKAQLGAGKGNFFDDQMVEMLRQMSLEERGAYILQEKIWPIIVKNYVVRPFKQPFLENMVSEVGIYGTLLGTAAEGGKVLWNSVDGYLVRSKAANVNQGGVSDGAGVIDSLLLFPAAKLQEEARMNGKA
jgi:glutathione synthase